MAILLITRKDAETRLKAAQVTNIECWINGLVAMGLIKLDLDKIVIDIVETVCNRPHITKLGREWFGIVTMENDLIKNVK